MRRHVCHFVDSNLNLDAHIYRAVARLHDRERFPVSFCTTEAANKVKDKFAQLGTAQLSLGVVRRWQYPLAVLRLARLLKRERISILHAHLFDPTIIGLIAARLAGARFVFTRHHSDHHSRIGKRWHVLIDAWCARLADHVIAVSQATKNLMVENEGVPAKQISVVYNGMKPLEEPEPEAIARVRQELNLGSEPVVLMLARLHEEKGHAVLFCALPEVVACVGRVTVLLGGEGPHRAALEADAERRGLGETVRFLGRRSDVPELISLASVLVLPSLAESFGYVSVEAMSLGKPVVASTAGGIPEVIADGETGLLVPICDARALAQAICRVLKEPGLAQTLGEAGRARANTFGLQRMVEGYEAVYERVTHAAASST